MSSILICEPDLKLQAKLSSCLNKSHYETRIYEKLSADAMPDDLKNQALVIMDTQMKWSESWKLLEAAAGYTIPVLFLTRESSKAEHLKAMFRYRCEVLFYPISEKDLLRAIHSLLMDEAKTPVELIMDQKEKTAELDGRKINLTSQEYALLSALMESPNTPVSREYLLRKAWGYQSMGETRTVDVHVQRLRKKFGTDLIETVYKCGYRLNLA